MSHWSINYIGEPWLKGEHECGHFFVRVQREQFGIEIETESNPETVGELVELIESLMEN